MQSTELTVFQQTSNYSELRLAAGADRRTRPLNKQAVDDLIAMVDRTYAPDTTGHRVFGASDLRDLGAQLFAFLDGDDRWLADVLDDPRGTTVRIAAEERLRHLPWELTAKNGAYLSVRSTGPVLPVRASSAIAALGDVITPSNRPLRVLFMATSPEGVQPELGYEAEEAAILTATATAGVELVVEESGTLAGLRFTVDAYGAGYFDVLHVSGHATVSQGKPLFVVEDELGMPATAGPDEIAKALAGRWPRLVFVSGCLTGSSADAGTIPSMSESLVTAGASTVLGWALPVGDVAATDFAAHLYADLASGAPLDRAVVEARQHLYTQRNANWHLLRVYADKSPLTPVVTPGNTPGRERTTVRQAADAFLDPQTGRVRVAPREQFVGRRRQIQRCLRTLQRPLGTDGAVEALVLYGMGGLGKSTLASRLLERMPTHRRVVWYGGVDETKLRELVAKIDYPTVQQQDDAAELMNRDKTDLEIRLRFLLKGPLASTPCLFVFDDFEQGNLDERDGAGVLSNDMARILPALLTAIAQTNSPSRVIITSRYQFPVPRGTAIHFEALETFTDVEQTKKLTHLPNLQPTSTVDADIRTRAIEAAAGNPRLLEWLDKIVADQGLDIDGLIAAIEGETERFRESILAEKLLASLPDTAQSMLAKINVVELPIPAATVYAVHDHPDGPGHVERAVKIGLLEEGLDPETREPRYFVSNVLRPLLRPRLSDAAYTAACAAAARSLYQIWVDPQLPGEPEPS